MQPVRAVGPLVDPDLQPGGLRSGLASIAAASFTARSVSAPAWDRNNRCAMRRAEYLSPRQVAPKGASRQAISSIDGAGERGGAAPGLRAVHAALVGASWLGRGGRQAGEPGEGGGVEARGSRARSSRARSIGPR